MKLFDTRFKRSAWAISVPFGILLTISALQGSFIEVFEGLLMVVFGAAALVTLFVGFAYVCAWTETGKWAIPPSREDHP